MGGREAGQEGWGRVGEVAVVRVDRVRREPAHYGTYEIMSLMKFHVADFLAFLKNFLNTK